MIKDVIDKAKKEHKKVYIYAHKYPDGDAIGSSSALVLYLENQGIEAKYVITEPLYSFKQIVGEIPTTQTVDENSISIIIDTTTIDYCQNTLFSSSVPQDIYVIDHHGKTENAKCIEEQLNIPSENIIRNPNSSSASEILLNEFDEEKISPTIANILTLGLITDTARLNFLKESTLQNLIKLLKLGVNYTEILSLCTRKNILREEVGLAKLLLNTKQIPIGDTFGLILTLDHKTVNDMHCQYGVRNVQKKIFKMNDITNCSFTYISSENAPNEFDLEFRSTETCGNLNVLNLATEYGGGGHFNASGCRITQKDKLESLVQSIPERYKEQVSELKPINLTKSDIELSQLLTQTEKLSKNVTIEILTQIENLIQQGANYVYTYKNFRTLEQFMLKNELLSKIPESTFSQKFPIVSIYLSKQEINELSEKYQVTEDDILKAIDVFADINIKFATISLSGGKKVQIDRNGIITTRGSSKKVEKNKELIH